MSDLVPLAVMVLLPLLMLWLVSALAWLLHSVRHHALIPLVN
jgi:hypothetical protein